MPNVQTYKPIAISVDNEESDDGFFSVGFVFNHDAAPAPQHLGLCRDACEDPTKIYVEADDQVHGFYTANARFMLEKSVLFIELLDENFFYWDRSKIIGIELPAEEAGSIRQCLLSIFSLKAV